VKFEYCKDLNRYNRRSSIVVKIGSVLLGGNNPIRIQSMTNTDTLNTTETVNQIMRIEKAGSDFVRLTVPGRKDAENLANIKTSLQKYNCNIPLVADIHFNPNAAQIAATIVDKVRINPGNYVDKNRIYPHEYSNEEYNSELLKIKKELGTLLELCKKHQTAIRIGTNHGSLSDRIVNRFGDTPEGMVESVLEFLRICRDEDFNAVVVSIKASNARIMVYTNRLLVSKMEGEKMHYPLHLGVTEAGEGEDGRIKSAVGIGTLLADGIGETIRISLSEDPELEIPVARKLIAYIEERVGHQAIPPFGIYRLNPFEYNKRSTFPIHNLGGNSVAVVVSSIGDDITFQKLETIGWKFNKVSKTWTFEDMAPDYIFANSWPEKITIPDDKGVFIEIRDSTPFFYQKNLFPLFHFNKKNSETLHFHNGIKFIQILASDLLPETIENFKKDKNAILVIETNNVNGYADQRAAVLRLINYNCQTPVIFKRVYSEVDKEYFQVKSSADLGGLFIDGLGDGIWIENTATFSNEDAIATSFGILQASRVRVSKTEYISCPSCGRTLFDLQKTIKIIRQHTAHLKGLKIGIMGCIVNGPGEMADSDYGYVGSGKGRITLYKGKELVKRNIAEDMAVDELINLIKENGDWVEP